MATLIDLLGMIRQNESGGNYNLTPSDNYAFPASHASGAYQIQPSTWQAWTQASGIGTDYSQAYQAPPSIQDQVAAYGLETYGANSTQAWAASAPPGGYPSLDSGGDISLQNASYQAGASPYDGYSNIPQDQGSSYFGQPADNAALQSGDTSQLGGASGSWDNAMPSGSTGTTGSWDSGAFGLDGPNYSAAGAGAPVSAQNPGDISGIVGKGESQGLASALGQDTSPAKVSGGLGATGKGPPVYVTDISYAGQAAGKDIAKSISGGTAQLGKNLNADTGEVVKAGTSWLGSFEKAGTDIFVRSGLVLMAFALLIGAWLFFSSESRRNAEPAPLGV